MEEILTAKEVAEKYFGGRISVSTIYNLVRTKQIPYLQISTKKFFFNTKSLDEWFQRQTFVPKQDINEYGKLRQIK